MIPGYPVEPFGFKFVSRHPLPFLPDGIRDGSGKEPDLFEQLDDGQTNEFQIFHSNGFGFNFPQSTRCGKKGRLAMISVFANPSLLPKPVVWCCVSVPRGNRDRHPRKGNCRV